MNLHIKYYQLFVEQYRERKLWKMGKPPRIHNAHLLALSGAIRDA